MNPFDQHTFEILIPKQHVLEDLQLKQYSINTRETLVYNENLLKLLGHSNDCFRYHLIQGEILRFFVILQLKSIAIMTENSLKEVESMYPRMKFSMQMTKNLDAKSTLEINVPTMAKFLNSQTFNSQYEEKATFMGEIYEAPNLAFEYAFDKKNGVAVYLLFLPILNAVEDLEANLKMSIKIVCSQVDLRPEVIADEIRTNTSLVAKKFRKMSRMDLRKKEADAKPCDDIYGKYLDIIQRHLLKKQKKDFSVNVEKKVRLISPFSIQTESHQNCMKEIILIRVKNNLKSIVLKDVCGLTLPLAGGSHKDILNLTAKGKGSLTNMPLCSQEGKNKRNNLDKDLGISVKNIEFLLSNSSVRSIYNTKERDAFFPGLAENFMAKIMGIEEEFNIVITLDQIEYDNSKYIKTLPPLLLPCTACQNENPQILEDISLLSRSNTEYQKLPTARKDRMLSIQQRLPEKMGAPISNEFLKQARKKSSLQQLHEDNMDSISPRKEEPSASSPRKNSPMSSLQVNTRKSYLQDQLPGVNQKNLACNCSQVINNGLNLMVNTPLIIRWSLDDDSNCCSVQKIMWTFKSSYILSVDISMDKTTFKREEIIEFEITVKNNTFEEMDLVCIMIDECIENNYQKPNVSSPDKNSYKKSSIDTLPSALKKSPIIRDINDVEVLEKIFNVISNQVQIMALSLQKDINFPKLKSGEKSTRKVRLLPIHPGLLKIDELVFHDKISQKFIKVGINLFFVIDFS